MDADVVRRSGRAISPGDRDRHALREMTVRYGEFMHADEPAHA